MEPQFTHQIQKKTVLSRKKTHESSEFQSEITLMFDEFFRYFNYNYPGKNKDDVINKCLTGNIYWMLLDSLYYPDNIDLQMQKIKAYRKKSVLKNGIYPPTKDNLEEQKFILFVRKMMSQRLNTLNLSQLRSVSIQHVIQALENSLQKHQLALTKQLEEVISIQAKSIKRQEQKFKSLGIPIIKAAKLFAYETLQKQVIKNSIQKAELKQKEPRCDFCFIRDRDLIKCKSCDFYTHSTCFTRAQFCTNISEFQCDTCLYKISRDSKCQLCPIQNGHFLELSQDAPLYTYCSHKGQSSLKVKIIRENNQGYRQKRFIHVSCYVMRQQECTYNSLTHKVEGIHLVDRTKKNPNICSICGNMIGITISCNHESCRRSFHPQCAKRHNLSINVIKSTKALLQIYCERHKKLEPHEYLRDSLSNRIKQLKKFYENLDYELKKYGYNSSTNKSKKVNKLQDLLKQNKCLACQKQNDYKNKIVNCRRCYGWYHRDCSKICPYCD